MDPADQADAEIALFYKISLASQPKSPALKGGQCAFCNEKLEPAARFCDAACRDDFERQQNRLRPAFR